MSFNDFECKLVSKPVDEISNELNCANKLQTRHEMLCRTLTSWQLGMEQNSSQLEILGGTAQTLSDRHKNVVDLLASKKGDPVLLKRLQREIHAMELQVDIWLREISDVSKDRIKMALEHSFEFSHQNQCLQRSATNMEMAKIDADFLCRKHCKIWRQFLAVDDQQQKTEEQ